MKKIMNCHIRHKRWNRAVAVSILFFVICASIFAGPTNNTETVTNTTVSDNKQLAVKIFPSNDIVIGFSDKHPTSGSGYLDPFPEGKLTPDGKGNMVGVFYLYDVNNTSNSRPFSVTVTASALIKADGTKPLAYNILIDDFYTYINDGSNWVAQVPAKAGNYPIAIGNSTGSTHDENLLSNATNKDNIWFRTIKISVPMDSFIGSSTVGETWTGTLKATLSIP